MEEIRDKRFDGESVWNSEGSETFGTAFADVLKAEKKAGGKSCLNRAQKKKAEKSAGSVMEQEFDKAVRRAGGLSYKVDLPETEGMPDRMVLFSSGACIFVAFVAERKGLQPIQVFRWRQLESLGIPVICISNLVQILPAVRAVSKWNSVESFPEEYRFRPGGLGRRFQESHGPAAEKESSFGCQKELSILRQMILQLKCEAYQQMRRQKLEDLERQEAAIENANLRKPVNTRCEFHENQESRNVCLIHMDVGFCSTDCAFATTDRTSTPPYGTRYMKRKR